MRSNKDSKSIFKKVSIGLLALLFALPEQTAWGQFFDEFDRDTVRANIARTVGLVEKHRSCDSLVRTHRQLAVMPIWVVRESPDTSKGSRGYERSKRAVGDGRSFLVRERKSSWLGPSHTVRVDPAVGPVSGDLSLLVYEKAKSLRLLDIPMQNPVETEALLEQWNAPEGEPTIADICRLTQSDVVLMGQLTFLERNQQYPTTVIDPIPMPGSSSVPTSGRPMVLSSPPQLKVSILFEAALYVPEIDKPIWVYRRFLQGNENLEKTDPKLFQQLFDKAVHQMLLKTPYRVPAPAHKRH